MLQSPPFRRTTRAPFRACSMIKSLISFCEIDGPNPSFPALMITASRLANSRISLLIRRSWIITSAISNSFLAFNVKRSGSPGPALTKTACPSADLFDLNTFKRDCSDFSIPAMPLNSSASGPFLK